MNIHSVNIYEHLSMYMHLNITIIMFTKMNRNTPLFMLNVYKHI